MSKICGNRASATIYSRKELEDMALERLGSRQHRLTKREICEALGIEWREGTMRRITPIENKVCTDKRSRRYPNRYTKEELVQMARARNPYLNRTRLLRDTYRNLCRLARIPFLENAVDENAPIRRRTVGDRARFFKMSTKEKEEDTPCLERGGRAPFQYQRRVVEHLRDNRGLVAVHSLGSGKTLTALYASQCYLDQHPTHRVVVVSPATLIDNFKKEMTVFQGLRHADRYEFFSYQGFYSRYKARRRNCRDTMLIVDEAHNLRTEYRKGKKKEVGKYCGAVTRCAEMADRILLLTATPLVNSPSDIVPLLNMVRNNPTTQNRLLVKDFKKNIDNDEYLERVGLCRFSFYERDRVSEDYPGVIEEDVFLPMPRRFYETYRKVEEDLAEDEILRTFGESQLRPFFNGVRRAVNILSELPEEELVKSPKIKWILRQIREDKRKTLVFSNFLEMGLDGIIKRLPPGVRAAFITGGQPRARRAEIVRQYNRDEIDVLFLSRAGGEGIDLKGTRRIILLENGWNENSERQVIGRGVRYRSHSHLPAEERNVHIYRLFHIKPDEVDHIDELLSPETEIVYNDPSTWLSADLMLKKISERKHVMTSQFLDRLKRLSIERNHC